MKTLSDYKGEEAIDLWADLLNPITAIIGDTKIQGTIKADKPKTEIAKMILKSYKAEAVEILLRIDPEPIDGLNIVLRLVELITEIGKNKEIQSFFGFADQEKPGIESFGSVTANTEGNEN
jgi:hypothetical protein